MVERHGVKRPDDTKIVVGRCWHLDANPLAPIGFSPSFLREHSTAVLLGDPGVPLREACSSGPLPSPNKRDTVRSLQELFGSVLYMHFPLSRPDALLHLCAHTCVQERVVSPRSASLTVKDFINNCLGKISLRRMATDAAPSSIPTESLPLI